MLDTSLEGPAIDLDLLRLEHERTRRVCVFAMELAGRIRAQGTLSPRDPSLAEAVFGFLAIQAPLGPTEEVVLDWLAEPTRPERSPLESWIRNASSCLVRLVEASRTGRATRADPALATLIEEAARNARQRADASASASIIVALRGAFEPALHHRLESRRASQRARLRRLVEAQARLIEPAEAWSQAPALQSEPARFGVEFS